LDDFIDDFLKIDRMHQTEYWAVSAMGRADGRPGKT
jgi:hypothetical protein